jgi:hypothetical protein
MIIPAAVAFAIGAGAHGDVLAAANKLGFDKDVAAMLQAKVTLAEAIATAEKEAGGKAINAGVDKFETNSRARIRTRCFCRCVST